MNTTLQTTSAAETEALGEALGPFLQVGDLVVLTGDLGTGKTTFTKGLARGLGVTDRVTSPTFTIVQEYDGRVPVAHVDVYRLDRIQELHDFGFEELVETRVTIVEWGEAIALVLPRERIDVRLAMVDAAGPGPDDDDVGVDDRRVVEISAVGPAWGPRWPPLESAAASVLAGGTSVRSAEGTV
jgi:tRNA threonylcarbamoyladenosine biosynthesis protein TsaE